MTFEQPILNKSPEVSDEIRKTTCYMCACRCGINVHMKTGQGRLYRRQPGSSGQQGCPLRQRLRRYYAALRPLAPAGSFETGRPNAALVNLKKSAGTKP